MHDMVEEIIRDPESHQWVGFYYRMADSDGEEYGVALNLNVPADQIEPPEPDPVARSLGRASLDRYEQDRYGKVLSGPARARVL